MKRTILVLCLVLAVISVVGHLPVLQMSLGVYDEGIVLAGADRVLQGQIPYRDFWSMYPPGQFYALAFLFRLFGPSVLVERIYDLAVRSLLVMCGFLLVGKLGCSVWAAVSGWAMALLWTSSTWFPGYPVYVALLLVCVGILFFLHYLEKTQARWLVCSGLVMALGAIFRHDLGGLAAIVVLFALLLERVVGEGDWRSIGAYLSGVLLAGLPACVYFAAAAGVGTVLDQLIVTPADVMPKYRWLPYPALSLETLAFYLFPLVLCVGLALSLILVVRNRRRDTFAYGLLVLSLTGILFINQVRVRSDEIHLFPAAIVGIVVLPGLVSFLLSSSPKASKVAALAFVVAPSALFVGRVSDGSEMVAGGRFLWLERSSIVRTGFSHMGRDLEDVVSIIQQSTTEDEAIYVGVKNHDRFLINDVIIPFLAGRPYATRYHELHPGVTTTASVQQEIIKELESAPARLIVLRPGYWPEPNQTNVDAKVDLLDRYIAENYALVHTVGVYEVWLSRL